MVSPQTFEAQSKVVYIGPNDIPNLTHGQVYTVRRCYLCCKEAGYRIYLEEVGGRPWNVQCKGCGKNNHGFLTKMFRKVDDVSNHTTESLLEELSIPVRELQPA